MVLSASIADETSWPGVSAPGQHLTLIEEYSYFHRITITIYEFR